MMFSSRAIAALLVTGVTITMETLDIAEAVETKANRKLAETPGFNEAMFWDSYLGSEMAEIPQFRVEADFEFARGTETLAGNTDFIGAHLHTGDATTNGPVNVIFCGAAPLPSVLQTNGPCVLQNAEYGDTTFTAEWTQKNSKAIAGVDVEQFLTDLKACTDTSCNVYFNAHTSYSFYTNPGAFGVARGQLRPVTCKGSKSKRRKNKCYAATVTTANTNLVDGIPSQLVGDSEVSAVNGNILVTLIGPKNTKKGKGDKDDRRHNM